MGSKKERGIPSKLIKNFSCTSCHSQFFIKDLVLKGSKCPFLLHCGHSVCEACLNQNLKLTEAIICQLCGFSSPQSTDQLNKCFPLNIYSVGSIIVLQNARYENNKKLAFLTENDGNFNYEIKAQSNVKAESLVKVCEECSVTASWYCENCKSNYCELCWSKVHGSAKSLMKHVRVSVTGIENERNMLKKCPEHETQYLEFFCNGCSITVCSHCVILRHQGEGHCPITLKEKNLEILSKLKTAAEYAERMKKRMTQTLEKVKLTQNSSDNPKRKPFLDLESQITRNFSRLHGILQLEEDRLLKKLHERWSERESSMKAVQLQLENQMEYVEGLLREHESVVKKPLGNDLTDLHKQLTEVENLPCYLISQKGDNKEATISFDERLIEQLKTSYCKMDFPSDEVFELRSGSNLPEDYAVEPLDTSTFDVNLQDVPKPREESSTSDIDTVSNSSSRDLEKGNVKVPPTKTTVQGKVFQENKSYSVRVSYIKSPGEFYVTLNSQRPTQQAIDRRASQFASSTSTIPKTVSKDELYLVKYNVDKKWYRARVVEFFSTKKKWKEDLVVVYYIDYGNSEMVPLYKLRPIPPDMLEPPLAIKCKLFDCVPKNGVWCAESIKTMEKILNNYTATMFVMKVHRDCLEVDLSVIYPEGLIGRDIVSVRDALLFLEFSSFVHGPRVSHKANALKYLHQCLPAMGEKFDVIISHVNSPSDFYIQRAREDSSYLYKLSVDLQKYYDDNSEKSFIYNPSIGMPCAALFSSDQKWYRAKIVDIPGQKMVTVFYVDFGNKETISWTAIRKLKENFVKRPPVALNCTLAGIIPADVVWNTQAIAYLQKLEMVRDCSVHVHSRPKAKQKLKVFLYKRVSRKEVCVNNFFVEMGYATKSSSSWVWMMKCRGDEDNNDETPSEGFTQKTDSDKAACDGNDDGRSSDGDVPLRKGRYLEGRKKDKLSAKKLRELHEFEKKNSPCEDCSAEDVDEEEIDQYNNIFKVKVEILSAESPSSLYVTFPTLKTEVKHLQSQLVEFYSNSSPPEGMEWKPDAVCVAFDSEKCCWHRARILSILPDDRVKIFLKDIAKVSTVPVSALRELDSSFLKCVTGAVKCHLADVAPPGEQWPSISCEFLANELENYKEIYMTKKGQIENKSLPVELWVKKVISKGALEPTVKEWVTLNRLLVNQGLAVPVKQKIWCSSPVSNDDSDYMKDSENNRETSAETLSDEKDGSKDSDVFLPSPTSQWRPPEPLKDSCFVGIPTYVDYNACVYLHDVKEDGEKLKTITDSLREEYDTSKPHPEDHFWSPGQLCIARYHLDNSWYRGSILKINDDMTYDVLFVDYGNVETCQAKDLRKKIRMLDIPILTHKCRLHGIEPASEDGKWAVSVIDMLHSLVVDKKCEVSVLKPTLDPREAQIINLKIIESDVDVGKFLVEQGLATFRCSVSDDSDTFDSDVPKLSPSQSSKPNDDSIVPLYIPIVLPANCSGLFIEVTKVISETEFFAKILYEDSLSPGLKNVLEEFEILQQKLTEEGFAQPHLEKTVKGHPCCCVNIKNKKWCRAEIISCLRQENSVFVLFVDYGNREFYDKNSLHECKSEWLTLPKMALKFKLADVQRPSHVPETVYMKALNNCLSKPPIYAEIFGNHEELIEVKLLNKRNGRLAYQDMIDNKLMEFVE